jgi:hypothetical protein
MVLLVRLPPVENLVASTAEEIVKLHTTIDFLALAIFFSILPILLTLLIGCIIVVLMKGPAYVADAYELSDADRPEGDDKKF